MKILGIDPGYERVGVAIIEKNYPDKEVLVFSDCILTERHLPHPERLQAIGDQIEKIINKYKPECISVEKLFFNVNQKTALSVAEARGVILFIGERSNLEIKEYTPLEIKMAITGYGRADKKQMLSMIKKLVKINKDIKLDDEYDAIACALTAFSHIRPSMSGFPQKLIHPLAKKKKFDTNRKS